MGCYLNPLVPAQLGQERASEVNPAANTAWSGYGSYSFTEGVPLSEEPETPSSKPESAPDAAASGSAATAGGDEGTIPPHIVALISCPVCLEFMYRPHGLGCGHCMCSNCLLKGNKMEKAVAPSLRAMMTHLPYKKGSCPICRQAISQAPVELTALGRLVSRTSPGHYKACNKEYKRTQAVLRKQLEAQLSASLGLDSNPLLSSLPRFRSAEPQRAASTPAAARA